MSKALDHLAKRVADDPFFLAWVLAEYARAEKLDDAGLAAALGCGVADLTPLRLCRAPRADPADFRTDIGAMAERFGIAPAKLVAVCRRGEVLARLRAATPAATDGGVVIAARDKPPPPPLLPPPQEPPT